MRLGTSTLSSGALGLYTRTRRSLASFNGLYKCLPQTRSFASRKGKRHGSTVPTKSVLITATTPVFSESKQLIPAKNTADPSTILNDQRFMKILYGAMEDPLVLPFVDREEEVKALSLSLIKNSLKAAMGTPDNQAYLLPFLPQMFGAGKTIVGVELLQQARKYRGKLLQELQKINLPLLSRAVEQEITMLPQDQQVHARARRATQLITEQLDKFLGATYVRVSLDRLPAPSREFTTFTEALWALIRQVLEENGIAPLNGASTKNRPDIQALLTVLTGGRSVVIHFDDVGSLLNPEKYRGYFVEVDTDAKWEMRRIYKFWDEIHVLNKMDGTYCFISGKRSALIFLGLKLPNQARAESPTGAISVILSMLSPRYVRQVADKLGFWQRLGITDENLKERVVTAIHQLTGGVPRLVSFSLKVLMQGADRMGCVITGLKPVDLKLTLRELLYDVFTHDERSNVLASSEILTSPKTAALYLRLLVLSYTDKVIDKNMRIEFIDETTAIPLSVVISALDCYVDKEVGDSWKLVFPELVLLWVASNSPYQRLRFFASSILADPDVARPGQVNEKIFRLTLETLLTFDPVESSQQPRPLGEVLPFLAGTKLAGWHLQMHPNGFIPLPKITKVAKKLDEGQRKLLMGIVSKPREEWIDGIQDLCNNKNDKWVATVLESYTKRRSGGGGILEEDKRKLVSFLTSAANFSDSDFILDHMLPDGYLGCPTSDTSGWPDFVIKQHQAVAQGQQKQRVLQYVLWWQIKLLGEDTNFSWAEIKEEISKVPELGTHRCLVIVSTVLSTDVQACIGNNTRLLLLPGDFVYKGKCVLTVPAQLEVVVLGNRGLVQLYSEYDLDGLKRLAREQTFESISKRLVQPIVPLAGVSLMPAPVPVAGRTIKLTFVDGVTKTTVGNGMADIPFGTALSAARVIIGTTLNKKVVGRTVVGLEWEGVAIEGDAEMECIRHRDEVIVLLQ